MGNSHNDPNELPKYQWKQIDNCNGVDLFQRSNDGLVAERRKLSLDHHFSLDKEQRIYKMRELN